MEPRDSCPSRLFPKKDRALNKAKVVKQYHSARLRVKPFVAIILVANGAVAQLGERLPCTED